MVLYPNKLPESERVCSGICTLEKKYTIQGVYKGKIFIIKLLYPMLYIKEKGTRAVMGIRINASRKMLDKSLIIEYFEYKE